MIGETLSHYRITGLLGQGGMGVVYRAQDLRLGRAVAIKVLRPGAAGDPEHLARFEREAQTASRLDHPNVGIVHEIGETADGAPFIVMAYYSGETLRERLKAGPLTTDEAIRIATKVAAGLGAAHRAGIVHRDVKPENIIVTDKDTVKVIDFGIAKLATADTLTKADAVSGSAYYMAPEQALGAVPDARADVWALGVMLYEMLAGRHPFQGAYSTAVLYQAAHEAPPPLDSGHVPEPIRRVVDRCLAKDPDGRYADAADLADALAAASETGARHARPRLHRRWRRPAVFAVGIAGVVAAALAVRVQSGDDAAALARLGQEDLREHYDPAHVASAVSYFERSLALDSSAATLAGLGQALIHQGQAGDDSSLAAVARGHAERALRLDPDSPDAHNTLGLVDLWTGDAHEALRRFQLALHHDSTNAAAWEGVGSAYLDLDEIDASMRAYRRAIQLAPERWSAHHKLGFVQYVTGDYSAAARAWARVTDLAPANGDALSNRGALLFALERFEEARGVFEDLIAQRPDGDSHANLATAFFYEGQFEKAAAHYERSLRYHPDDHEKLGYLATTYAELDDPERTRQTFARAERALRQTPDWDQDALLVSELATYRAALGDAAEARHLAGLATTPPPTSIDVMVNVASAYGRLGDRRRAAKWTCTAIQAGYSRSLIARTPALAESEDGPDGWGDCPVPRSEI